ncbi:AraC family transcriptional regulator [Streptomyces albiflaviniger]|nr:AraC family transcriptional regulator [Streptomyces albiflaviniger]
MATHQAIRWQGDTGTYEVVWAAPHQRLRGQVLCYRGYRVEMTSGRTRLEVPDGAVSVLLGLGGNLRISSTARPDVAHLCTSPVVTGMRSRAWTASHSGRLYGIEVLMTPRAAYGVFGVPLGELTDRNVELGDLFGRGAMSLLERIAWEPTWSGRFRVLDRDLLQRMAAGRRWVPQVEWAWRVLRDSHGMVSTAGLAAEAGVSLRHLEGRFRQQVGLSPKTMARVLRLQRVLRLLDNGAPAGHAAAVSGYHDQSHMCREIKAMTGQTVGGFLVLRGSVRPEQSAADRVPRQVTSALLK